MKKATVILGILALAVALQGCGTMISIAEPHCMEAQFGPYSGVSWDVRQMDTPSTLGAILLCLDLPVSFVMDTILLPVSLPFMLIVDRKGSP